MLKQSVKTYNPIAYKMIAQAFLSNKLAHAFLFSALPNYEIVDEWKLLAQFLITNDLNHELKRDLTTYPDLIIVDGSKSLIKKENILNALNQMSQTSLEKDVPKILIIRNIENANKQSVNALLKFLEEPPMQTFMILTTNQEARVLPTIKSRAQIIKLKAPRFEDLIFALAPDYPQTYQLLAALITNLNQAKQTNDLIIKYQGEINKLLKKSLTSHDYFFPHFYALITKDNYLIICQILQVFFNDIWKIANNQKIIWDRELALAYQKQHFNFHQALNVLNHFLIAHQHNVNFDLAKTKLLILLGQCYG